MTDLVRRLPLRPDAERLLFVYVRSANGNGNGEDGDVHHNHIADLDGRMKICQTDRREAGSSGGRSLEPSIEEAIAEGEMGDCLVIQIKNDEENQVDYVEGDENPEQPPSGFRGE